MTRRIAPMVAMHTGTGTYEAKRAEAQAAANADGHDRGVEPAPGAGAWRCFLLSQRQFRAPHERACEVVHCQDHERCPPGHGPAARDVPHFRAGAEAMAEWQVWWSEQVRQWARGERLPAPPAASRRVILHQRGRTIVFR